MRLTTLYLIVGEPDVEAARECPECGFDSLLAFPLTSLSENGVGLVGSFDACGRCWEPSDDWRPHRRRAGKFPQFDPARHLIELRTKEGTADV